VNYDCQTNTVQSEDCIGTIKGTLFDASDLSSCDLSSNPPKIGNQSFGLTGNWPIINPPASTNADGTYSEAVYASTLPAVYTYDYSDLINSGKVAGVKFQCQAAVATVTDQGQIFTKDTGFWRIFGGWWQVTGGNIYGANGIQSVIPGTLSAAAQRLILSDGNGRYGVLTYGTKNAEELGTNPNARVSDKLWEYQSLYQGLRYDYNYYNTRMDVFASTAWDGGDLNYNDGGAGYQIFKHTGDVTLGAVSLSGTQKAVLLVDGKVTVNGDLLVPNGAFLGIIASGDITFNANVTKAQGWFVAENINILCHDGNSDGKCDKDDTQFAGQGSFVGWTNVNLGRDQGLTNNSQPAEKFTYRPDMMVNVPTPMKVYTRKFTPFIP